MKHVFWVALLLLNQSCVTIETKTEVIAFSSCNEPGQDTTLLPTLSNALDTIPTFVWLGDNVYLKEQDWQSAEALENKYKEVFEIPLLKEILGKGTHYAVWDDHDAGPNDCDGSFDGLPLTMKGFKDFWKPDYEMPDNHSFYGSKIIKDGAVELFFLDNRTYRVHHDSSNATVFGEQQLQWFEKAYTNSKATFKVLLMGGQFLPTAQVFDNVSRFPAERQRIIDIIRSASGSPIVLTGDRHHGEISRLEAGNKVILEGTASPLTAKSFPHHDEPNETRVHEGTTEVNHFGILELEHQNNQPKSIRIRLIDSEGNAIFSWRETF